MKLLTLNFFVDQPAQVDANTNSGRYFCMMREWTSNIQTAISLMSKDDPDAVYMAIDGPANSKLEPAKIFPGSMTGWLPVMISKSCKNPDRAIRFITYWASEEGQKDFFLGKKGVTWDTIDGKDQLLPELVEEYMRDEEAFSVKYGAVDTYWMLRNPVTVFKWRPPKPAPIQQMIDWANKHADYSGGIYKDMDPVGDTPEGIAWTKIATDWGQTLPKLLTAKSDEEFDKIWNDFLRRREEAGFDKVMAYRQAVLDERKEKLK